MDHSLLNQTAPEFTLADSDGQFLSLGDFRGRTVLLVFLRHFAWLPWREHLSQLRQKHGEIEARGAAVLAVSFETRDRLFQLSRQLQLPFPLLSDQERDIYRAYGLQRGYLRQIFSLQTIMAYVKLLARGRFYHFRSSDLRQLGGDFIVDPEGVIRYQYRSAAPHDRPTVDELMRVVDAI